MDLHSPEHKKKGAYAEWYAPSRDTSLRVVRDSLHDLLSSADRCWLAIMTRRELRPCWDGHQQAAHCDLCASIVTAGGGWTSMCVAEMLGEQRRMFGAHPADANRTEPMPPDLLESSSRPESFHTSNSQENDSPGRRRSLRYKSTVPHTRQSSTLLCSAHNLHLAISPYKPAALEGRRTQA